jgi:hypothetical protein
MPFATGIVLAVVSGLTGRLAGFDRDRAFYPTLVIVIASYYVLFAAMGGSTHVLLVESVAMLVFACIAIAGFRTSLWVVAAALAGHGVFDLVHGRLVSNPGVPMWWPSFCGAYDVFIGAFLSWLLYSGALRARGTGLASTVG